MAQKETLSFQEVLIHGGNNLQFHFLADAPDKQKKLGNLLIGNTGKSGFVAAVDTNGKSVWSKNLKYKSFDTHIAGVKSVGSDTADYFFYYGWADSAHINIPIIGAIRRNGDEIWLKPFPFSNDGYGKINACIYHNGVLFVAGQHIDKSTRKHSMFMGIIASIGKVLFEHYEEGEEFTTINILDRDIVCAGYHITPEKKYTLKLTAINPLERKVIIQNDLRTFNYFVPTHIITGSDLGMVVSRYYLLGQYSNSGNPADANSMAYELVTNQSTVNLGKGIKVSDPSIKDPSVKDVFNCFETYMGGLIFGGYRQTSDGKKLILAQYDNDLNYLSSFILNDFPYSEAFSIREDFLDGCYNVCAAVQLKRDYYAWFVKMPHTADGKILTNKLNGAIAGIKKIENVSVTPTVKTIAKEQTKEKKTFWEFLSELELPMPTGNYPCPTCSGTGKVSSCSACGGRGKVQVLDRSNPSSTYYDYNSRGYRESVNYKYAPCYVCISSPKSICPECKGSGRIKFR
ncbi:MAG: hypothetical protein NZM35_03290 [Chitinophagales bacterium]|nr:hypothetical protein [Chitinophagales bacterium]